MKATELRIGNYYLWNGEVCVVGELRSDYAHKVIYKCRRALSFNQLHFYKQMQPIQLTEEWLIKFGWYKRDANRKTYSIKEWWQMTYSDSRKMWCFRVPGSSLKDIKYVHQLQNLYFSLTSEELTINTV